MRNWTTGILLCALLSGGCDGGGSSAIDPLNDPELLPVAECTALHVRAFSRFIDGMQDLFDHFNGAPLAAGITEIDPDKEYQFALDLEPDGTPDFTIDLVITGGDNISDGMEVNESIDIDLNVQGAIVGVFGIRFSRFATNLHLGGPVSLENSSGTCSFSTINVQTAWDTGDTDTISPNLVFTSTESSGGTTSTFSGVLFLELPEGEVLLAFGQLTVGAGSPVNKGFAIDPDTFEVGED